MKGLRLFWYVEQMRSLRARSSALTGSEACHASSVDSMPSVLLSASGVSASSRSVVEASPPSYRTAM